MWNVIVFLSKMSWIFASVNENNRNWLEIEKDPILVLQISTNEQINERSSIATLRAIVDKGLRVGSRND